MDLKNILQGESNEVEYNVQVALYDDRLEVTSPGMLTNGITMEQIKEGYSKVRNQGLAKAFAYMKIIEAWGSGIPRIYDECKEYGIKPLELIEFGHDFRAILWRDNAGSDEKITEKVTENAKSDGKTAMAVTENPKGNGKSMGEVTETKILNLIFNNNKITFPEIAEKLGMSESGIRRAVSRMTEKGIMHRENNNRKGKWIIDKTTGAD